MNFVRDFAQDGPVANATGPSCATQLCKIPITIFLNPQIGLFIHRTIHFFPLTFYYIPLNPIMQHFFQKNKKSAENADKIMIFIQKKQFSTVIY